MKIIHSVTIGSAFKVSAVLSALLFAILGIFVILLPGLFGASLLSSIMGGSRDSASAFGVGFVTSIVIYFIGIVVYGVLGGIGGAIDALLYNLVAGIVGGLEIDID